MSKKNLSVKQLSHAGQVTYEMARRYTLGTAKPRDEKLMRIAEWLSVPPAWLDYGAVENSAESNAAPETVTLTQPEKGDETEFASLSDEEKRLIRVFRKFPDAEANNMLLAFEIRYKKLLSSIANTHIETKNKSETTALNPATLGFFMSLHR